ncbi:MAG: uroporphyrinogen decarboxylase family protein [Planctomycetota bacterium]
MTSSTRPDGIQALPAPSDMDPAAWHLRQVYAITPDIPLVQQEFGFYCREAWQEQGLPAQADYAAEFGYHPSGGHHLGGLGWCEAALDPCFETTVLEQRGEHELVRDFAGRHLLCFTGRRQGFMPEYVAHPVHDQRSWEEQIRWRLDPSSPGRWEGFQERMAGARAAAGRGLMIVQRLVGGYMYLRSLMGPEELLYAFYDQPDLVHDCMRTWFDLADAVIARHQEHVTLDEIFFAEDICYNAGPLIGPDMIRAFLLPYYQQLIANLRARQLDPDRHLYVQVDTDGRAQSVIDVYHAGIGMDVMSPFEVASGCDVLAIGRQYPWLVMRGGIDKRILARGPAAIDAELERLVPPLRARGGWIPTCDHGVPAEVPLSHYRHYRRRMLAW